MKVVGAEILTELVAREKRERPQQARALDGRIAAWKQEMADGAWKSSNEVKAQYANASFVGDNRVVFNICGNKYRLIVRMNYDRQRMQVRFAGTHAEYDDVDAATV
jgi:mRNA interferase HigB